MNFLFSAYQWRKILLLRSKWACRGELLLLSAICGYPISPIFADIWFSRISSFCGYLRKLESQIVEYKSPSLQYILCSFSSSRSGCLIWL